MPGLRLACAIAALAVPTAMAAGGAGQSWTTTGDAVLAGMRGGFATTPGLLVSFGITRTVLVDGSIVSRTTLQIPDVQRITADQARQLAQQAGITLVQSGTGNSVQGLQVQLAPGLVIQNTVSNRQLQAITQIDAATNTLRLFQGMNFNQALSDAIKGALTH